MIETDFSDRTEELTTLLDVARAISPNSEELGKKSRPSVDAKGTEELAVIKLLNDEGRRGKELFEILKGTEAAKSIESYLSLDNNEGENDPLISRGSAKPYPYRRVIPLVESESENGDRTYRIVKFDKEHNTRYQIDQDNMEKGDNGIVVLDSEMAKKLNEYIEVQRSDYEFFVNKLVKESY